MDSDGATLAESYLSELQATLTAPRERECLPCYLGRMLAGRGGFCDCEVLLNVYPEWLVEEDEPPSACAGVSRRGSTQPCRPVRR